jgi:D-alanine transaminase
MEYMELPAWWNGSNLPLGKVSVPVTDRGWLFGDAAYEVIRVYDRKLWLGKEHFSRLRRSLSELGISYDCKILENAAPAMLAASPLANGSLYIQISRGAGVRAHVAKEGMIPNVLMFVQPFDEAAWLQKMQKGITVTAVVDERWHRCDIKSVNLLANCMAATTAKARGFDEAVLVDERGIVSEGTHATFLWAKNQTVFATPLSNRILPGITRQKIADICKLEGIKFSETYLSATELISIDEAFLCGTTTEVMPIVRIDSQKVGNGVPGTLGLRLQKAYRKQISEKITNDLD